MRFHELCKTLQEAIQKEAQKRDSTVQEVIRELCCDEEEIDTVPDLKRKAMTNE